MSVKSELESLANAIRSKTGGSELLTIPGMAAAVDGLSVGGGGVEFYECTEYVPDFAGGFEYSFTLSGAPADVANGTYKRTKWVENPTGEWSDTPLAEWVNEKGCKFQEFYYSEYNYSIVGPSGILYESDSPYLIRVTDYNQISWVDSGWEPVTLTFSPWQTSELPPTVESWSGYLMQQDAESGAWSRFGDLVSNMAVLYQKPKVGDIYSADTSIRVRKMFDGAVYPIPADGLVFYAPLGGDYKDVISGKHAVTTAGSFTSRAGKDCLRLTNEYIKWDATEGLPVGEGDISLCFLVSPVDDSARQTYISIGDEDACVPIQYEDASILDFGGELPADSMMHSVCLTRKGTNNARVYIDGIFVNSRNVPFYPVTSFVCLGALTSYDYIQTSNAFFSDVAVYNRELSADEVAEIHAALMEDVE